jgi:hypothetical protein
MASDDKMLSNIEEEEERREEDPNFGMVAVDEMSVNENTEEANAMESDEDSDSTKSVIGSNQSLLRPPSRHPSQQH